MRIFALSVCWTVAILSAPNAFSADRSSIEQTLERVAMDAEKQNAIDYAVAPIKSKVDLLSYLHNKPANSPINKLSPQGLQHFVSSVQFNEKGVTTYDYSDLRAELSATQVYQVLALFGIQHSTSAIPGLQVLDDADRAIANTGNINRMLIADYGDYKCEARATCSSALSKICTSNC